MKTIAGRLLQHVRDEDTVCRNGGDQLITNADTAMYHAKKRSRGVAFFDRPNARGMTA